MRLYIVRHGETPWNIERRLQGNSDIPLNENGIRLAKDCQAAMADIPFTRVITSPLQRAVETARLLIGERRIPIVEDDRLREISFGEWEGLSCSRKHYEIPSESFNDFFEHPFRYVPPTGGESIRQVCERAADFLEELLHSTQYTEDTILISTHGCTLRALMNYFYQDFGDSFWRGHVPPNCGVSLVEIKDGQSRVLEEDRVYAG